MKHESLQAVVETWNVLLLEQYGQLKLSPETNVCTQRAAIDYIHTLWIMGFVI